MLKILHSEYVNEIKHENIFTKVSKKEKTLNET